ncbi:MAG: hypothetical protein ABH828_05015 [archaeon]
MNKKYFAISLLILLFILSSCSYGGRGGSTYKPDPERAEFFQGTEGLRMWVDPGAPPPRIYFYSDASDDYNTFSVDVEIHNVGSSWTTGGLYVSGYDPGLINLYDINIPKTRGGFFDNCNVRFSVRSNLKSSLGGIFSCVFGNDDNQWGIEAGKEPGSKDLDYFGIDTKWFDISWDGNSRGYDLDISGLGLTYEESRYGGEMVKMLEALTLDRFNGKSFKLRPDNHLYPGGESTIISFPGYIDSNGWPEGLDSIDTTFLTTACYAYSTYATPIVCIDPDPFSGNEKACTPGMTDLKGSQGAPVAITNVYQENTYRSSIFTIDIQNVGRGDIIYPGALELCSPYYPGRLGPQYKDTVILAYIGIGDTMLDCTPDGYMVKLRDGRGQITCTYEFEYATAKSAYTTPLVVELWYGYSESLRNNVHIKRVR